MKKFAKITAIIALVLTILGVTLLSVGAIGGGIRALKVLAWNGQLSFGPEDFRGLKWLSSWSYRWNRTNHYIDWDDDFFDIDDQFDFDEDGLFNFNYEFFSGGSAVYEADADEVENIQVQLGGADVRIVQWDKDQWRVEAESIGRFQSFVEGDTLKILGLKKGMNISYSEVTVYMPRNAKLGRAEISVGAGDMNIEHLAAEKAMFNVGAGSLTIKELEVSKIQMNVGAGDITVKGGVIGDMELATGMGSLTVKGNITGDIYSSVAMGEVKIIVCGSGEKDHNYELSCTAGEMRVGSRYNAGLGMDISIDNDAFSTYTLTCAMGSVTVTFQSEK